MEVGKPTSIEELRILGFQIHDRKPNLCVARFIIPSDPTPWEEFYEWGSLVGNIGDVVLWDVDKDYNHLGQPRFLKLSAFETDYVVVEDIQDPNEIRLLMATSLVRCYKSAPVYAKQVTALTFVASRESGTHTRLVPGDWLCISGNLDEGLFYGMSDTEFRSRYV